jgi:hypothetical protein
MNAKPNVTLSATLRRSAAIAGSCFLGCVLPSSASATDGAFQTWTSPGGGTILTGALGTASLPDATATLLRRVHAQLGTRPTVVQSAENAHDHSVALLFTVTRRGAPYTGLAIVTANPGGQAAGTALYDASSHFTTSFGPMLKQLQHLTAPPQPRTAAAPLAPAEPLVPHGFSDGTGSISVPADWSVRVAGGGSAEASAPGGAAQVSYNMHFGGLDPSNPRAQTFLRTATPLARAGFHGIVAPYTGDPVRSWKAMYEGLARQHGFDPQITITHSSRVGATGANIAGTLGSGAKTVHFIGFVFVLPPNPMGMWQLSDSHLFVTQSQIARQANTAQAVLDSIRIDFGAVAAQQDQIRKAFQQQFETEIASDRAADAARAEHTREFLASDRAAQEGMHKQAVAMENYSLDRAVVVNARTGRHSTLDSNFAETLVQDNPNYQKVPASGLLRGVDY